MAENKWGINLDVEHSCQCPRCARNGRDRSCNNLKVYGEDKGAFCWSCNFTIPSVEHMEAMGWDESDEDDEEIEEVMTREKITLEENERIKSVTTTDGKGYRGIRKDTNNFFGVRYQVSEETGEIVKQFVPTTINSELCGYRTRVLPKDFSNPIGQVGKEVDFIGEFRFKSHTRTLLIVGGEIKMLAAYQILLDDQKSRDKMNFETVAVVCSTLGESGAAKQAQSRYEFCDQFSKIIVAMDSDEAGNDAAEKLAKVLPRGKVFIMKMRYKDADTYIEKGKEKEFVQDYWNAKPWSPAGLYTADQLYDAALAHISMERLKMPSFLPKLNQMLGGGIPKGGCILLIAAASSIGKTTVLNQCLVEWIMNDDERFGVVSLEATAGDYAANLISYYTKTRYMGIESREDRITMMSSDATKEAARELFTRDDGSPRFVLCDDRGEKLDVMQKKIEEMVKAMGCTAILIDVTSDLLSGLTVSEQEVHMDWQKKLTKETGVTLINVVHLRKAASGQKEGSRGAAVSDESIMGSSTLYKSAAIIVGLERDKMAEEDFARNTTKVKLLKNRANADTGPAGELYYDKDSHRLHAMEDWMAANGVDFQ